MTPDSVAFIAFSSLTTRGSRMVRRRCTLFSILSSRMSSTYRACCRRFTVTMTAFDPCVFLMYLSLSSWFDVGVEVVLNAFTMSCTRTVDTSSHDLASQPIQSIFSLRTRSVFNWLYAVACGSYTFSILSIAWSSMNRFKIKDVFYRSFMIIWSLVVRLVTPPIFYGIACSIALISNDRAVSRVFISCCSSTSLSIAWLSTSSFLRFVFFVSSMLYLAGLMTVSIAIFKIFWTCSP